MKEHVFIMQTILGDSFYFFQAALSVAITQPKSRRAIVILAPVRGNNLAYTPRGSLLRRLGYGGL
jgi:hypothetical protein